MKTWKIFLCFAVLVLTTMPVWADFQPLREDVQGDQPQTTILRQAADLVEIEYRIPGVELLSGMLQGRNWDRVEIPGGGYEFELGAPEVPHYTRLLVIPATAGVSVEFEPLEETTFQHVNLLPAQGRDLQDLEREPLPVQYDQAVYSQNTFYPAARVAAGEPAVMRGLRVVALRTNPVQYNPVTHELRVTHKYRVTVHFAGTDLRHVPQRQFPLSRSWADMMHSQVLNFDDLDVDEQDIGSYLIICENDANLVSQLNSSLVDWKKRKGHTVVLQTFTPGASNTTIKALIQNAYDTWEIPPEYVMLFGDTDGDYALPAWIVSYSYGVDHQYSQLDGGDILSDVAVGRMPATNSGEVPVQINKVLFYEKMPYTLSSDWYHQSCLVAGSYYSGISTVQINRWIKTRMIWNNFTRIDTLWYYMGGSVPTTITNCINNGVSYVNYRGWIGMEGFGTSNIDALINGRQLPFVTTITCGTGGFNSSESIMEHFESVGTATTPKGAIACIGTATSSTHTRFNNTIDGGIYAGVFDEGLPQPGTALVRGKLELYNTYITNASGDVTNFSQWNNLAGDPGLELFTAAIRYMTCDVPATTTLGENTITLTVNETGVGPLQEAVVCVYKANELQQSALTDLNGQVTLPLSVTVAGNVKVTVTKHNFYPVVDSLDVVQAAVAVGYFSSSVDDDNVGESSGDNDAIINPNETVELPLTFKNFGTSTTATGISVTAAESDDYATLTDALETFPNMAPGAIGNSYDDFNLVVTPSCPDGHLVRLNLTTTSAQGTWGGIMDLPVVSYDMAVLQAYAAGTDTLLSPGETANFILNVRNNGHKSAAALTATIASISSYVTVNDNSASFGTVNMNAAANCSANPFNLTAASNSPPGSQADLVVTFTSSTGAVQADTIAITLGMKSSTDPQGPDAYGYYCFDNSDINYPLAPVYSWVEIDPSYGGSGIAVPINDTGENNDMSALAVLPFPFSYYGTDVDTITICSNGWIATYPDVSFTDFRNYPIPSGMGPTGHIAAFWDDLITWSGGKIFSKYDAPNHRYIVEWSRLKTLGSPSPQEVFEIILLDPAYYPTTTGDGEIIFQYHSITEVYGYSDDNPYSTIGVESPNHQTGLEVVYWNTYDDPAAAQVQNDRAYKFTTNFSYSLPPANLDVTMTPVSPPIQIPASGGNFSFNVSIANNGASSVTFDGWIMQILPNSTWQGPMIGPVNMILAPGATMTRLRTQNVPGSALPGTYTYIGYAGVYSGVKWDSSYFNYTKLSTGNGLAVSDWDNYGESFEPWMTKLAAQTDIPADFRLAGIYPNPFNPNTTISYDLPRDAQVNLTIFDPLGRAVATLVSGQVPAGSYQVVWKAADLPSGVYLLRLQADEFQAVEKLVLMK